MKDCKRAIKTDKGTADFPKAKEYQKMKIAAVEVDSSTNGSTCESTEEDFSSDESKGSAEGSKSENCEVASCYDEHSQDSHESQCLEGNSWDSEQGSE